MLLIVDLVDYCYDNIFLTESNSDFVLAKKIGEVLMAMQMIY